MAEPIIELNTSEELWEGYPKDWTSVTKDIAELMHKQCELTLSATIQSLDSISSKSDTLVGIYITISTALTAYSLSNFSDFFRFEILPMSAVLCLVVLGFGLYK